MRHPVVWETIRPTRPVLVYLRQQSILPDAFVSRRHFRNAQAITFANQRIAVSETLRGTHKGTIGYMRIVSGEAPSRTVPESLEPSTRSRL